MSRMSRWLRPGRPARPGLPGSGRAAWAAAAWVGRAVGTGPTRAVDSGRTACHGPSDAPAAWTVAPPAPGGRWGRPTAGRECPRQVS